MLAQFSLTDYLPDPSNLPGAKSNKRARVVCLRCHERKIRCDLWSKEDSVQLRQCSNCVDAGSPCQLRPSKRGTGKRNATSQSHPKQVQATVPVDLPVRFPLITPETILDGPISVSHKASDTILVSDGTDEQPLNQAITSSVVASGRLTSNGPSDLPSQQLQHPSYLGDSGYMQIFSLERQGSMKQQLPQLLAVDDIPAGLQESHLDVYYKYASTWCPILDREAFEGDPELHGSLLLRHALALCSNQIKPSLLEHASSLEHYNRAKELFYGNHEPNPLILIMAVMLFYWWSAESPNVVSLDTTWWWTGTAIRLAQQVGLHREPSPSQTRLAGESLGLRRRIWWTLVARERITALSQGRPCLIDLEDSDVPMPVVEDFSESNDIRTAIFVKWIPLCELIGRIGKTLRLRLDVNSPAIPLAKELITWVQSLPSSLQPALKGDCARDFNKDVHGLHLTYLSSITLLHFNKDAQPLPKPSITAIVAASCTARIFHDYLIRGSVTFLAGQAGWYITIAILALLHARRLDGLMVNADSDIYILRAALKEMARTWRSSQMFEIGVDKLMLAEPQSVDILTGSVLAEAVVSPSMDELSAIEGINWQDYFPYISSDTSPLIGTILASNDQAMRLPELGWTFDFPTHLNQFFARPEDFNVDFFSF